MTDAPPIVTQSLSKSYGSVQALTDLSLSVERGEIFGFLGPNGAGKTTTARLLLGLMRPTSGSARIFGTDVHAEGPTARRSVSYQPSADAMYESMRVAAYLRAFARMGGVPVHRTDELIERLDLDTSRRIKALSTGNRQKVAIVRALQADVPLYLLDEPTRGLDPLVQQEFGRILAEYRDEGRTIFLSTHILSEAESLCDRVGLLREGRLVAVERVDVLTESRVRRFHARFAGATPTEVDLEGATVVSRTDDTISFEVSGSVDRVIKTLAGFEVTDLTVDEPSLEDAFLRYYDQQDQT
ncbi:MAG: ABC transporter ATP-binding protein [Chloroflexota bacterium]|nr:ABC transporter ATP-binding protein [Chloroflexota bacterium]